RQRGAPCRDRNIRATESPEQVAGNTGVNGPSAHDHAGEVTVRGDTLPRKAMGCKCRRRNICAPEVVADLRGDGGPGDGFRPEGACRRMSGVESRGPTPLSYEQTEAGL